MLLLLLLLVPGGGFPSLYATKDPVEKTSATTAKAISLIFLKLDIINYPFLIEIFFFGFSSNFEKDTLSNPSLQEACGTLFSFTRPGIGI